MEMTQACECDHCCLLLAQDAKLYCAAGVLGEAVLEEVDVEEIAPEKIVLVKDVIVFLGWFQEVNLGYEAPVRLVTLDLASSQLTQASDLVGV